jgi:hypothetical protein
MALAELSFADHAKLSREGRSFDCKTCPERIQKLRRCREEREDFTSDDAGFFPMQVDKGGQTYGFCPGKATWDMEAVHMYRLLIVAAETGTMLDNGSLAEQTTDWIELLAWFLPFYDHHKFVSRVRMVLGDGSSKDSLRGR